MGVADPGSGPLKTWQMIYDLLLDRGGGDLPIGRGDGSGSRPWPGLCVQETGTRRCMKR